MSTPPGSPPFAAIQTGSGISLVYQSSGDQTLWLVTSAAPPTGNASDWSILQHLQNGINVASSPAGAVVNSSTIWLLYQGLGQKNLWYANNSPNWPNFQIQTTGVTTNMAPGLAQINGTLYVPFVLPSSGFLYITQAYTLLPTNPPQPPLLWQQPSLINVNGTPVASSFTPAVATEGGQLCIVCGSASELTAIQASPGDPWTSSNVPVTTTCTPSLVNVQGTFFLVYLGNNGMISFTASGDGQSWQGQPISLPSYMTTIYSPVAVALGNLLYIFYASSLNDGTIWYTWDSPFSPSGWQGPYQLPPAGIRFGLPPQP